MNDTLSAVLVRAPRGTIRARVRARWRECVLLRSSSTWPIRASGVCASMTWRSAAGVRSLPTHGLARVASWRVLSSYVRTESGMNLLDTLASCAGDSGSVGHFGRCDRRRLAELQSALRWGGPEHL